MTKVLKNQYITGITPTNAQGPCALTVADYRHGRCVRQSSMSTNPGEPDENAAWAAIVADLSQDPHLVRHTFITPPTTPEPDAQREDPDADDVFINALLDEGHEEFEPPDPGPLELPAHPVARFAWAGALGGPVVLVLSSSLGWGKLISGLAIAASALGFVTLIARHSDERKDGDNDGAVV
ncbi:unannotated protein [freshwater metagenome]|uniref:Unannotated protein n=2 Tax=freshwater metagenome TaxID=449393 RepID=A0A6J6J991_9ZZZZ